MCVFIVHDNENLSSVYRDTITSYAGVPVKAFSSVNEVVKVLDDEDLAVHTIITKKLVNDDKGFEKIYSAISNLSLPIKVICTEPMSGADYYPNAIFLSSDLELERMVEAVAAQAGLEQDIKACTRSQHMIGYPVNILLVGESFDTDIYLKKSDDRFSMVLKKGSALKKPILSVMKSNSDIVYVSKLDDLKFLDHLSNHYQNVLKDCSRQKNEQGTQALFELVFQLTHKVGMSPALSSLIDCVTSAMLVTVDQWRDIENKVRDLGEHKASYRYRYAMTTLYYACNTIVKSKLDHGGILSKMAYITLLCDVSLNEDKLIRIHDEYDLEKANLSDEEAKRVEEHALLSSQIVELLRTAPSGVAQAVKQHHGVHKGLGLKPDSENLTALSMFFMIASDFTLSLMKSVEDQEPLSYQEFIYYLDYKYGGESQLAKVIEYFRQSYAA